MTAFWDVMSYSMIDRYSILGERWYIPTALHDAAYRRTVIRDERVIIYREMKRVRSRLT
jgi:hypothetical protein